MNRKRHVLILAALLGVVFTAQVRAQLPNAWQINDDTTTSGSTLVYYTNLTTAQLDVATNNGWRFTFTSRMVASYGSANPAIFAIFGNGVTRYGIGLNLDSSGRLVVIPLGSSALTLTSDASTATNYHTHELEFDPATQQVTYRFDGQAKVTWPGQTSAGQSHQAVWGGASSNDRGDMNFHKVQFLISGQGVIATYDAGYAASPPTAPNPTTQGWTRDSGGAPVSEGPISPDTLPLPAAVTTLTASDVQPYSASLNAFLQPDGLATEYYFEYGLTTNYGAFTATNVIAAGHFTTNVSEPISGLSMLTDYHCRAIASNSLGVFTGQDISFSTTTPPNLVSSVADDGPGTLRSAVAFANTNAGSTDITFDPVMSGQTIVLTSGALVLSGSTTIAAENLTGGVAISGNQTSRIFEISPGAQVVLDSLTLRDGAPPGGNYPANSGGGLLNQGSLTLDHCTLQNSQAYNGGALLNEGGTLAATNCLFTGNSTTAAGGAIGNDLGTMTLDNCTISSNSVADHYGGGGINNSSAYLTVNNCTLTGNTVLAGNYGGGGIYNEGGGMITLNNSTLTANSAVKGYGGGIYISYDPYAILNLTNTIVAGNTTAYGPDVYGSYSGTNNLVGGDPRLAALGNYGGATPTMPPLPGSAAIDNGNDSVTNVLASDQRGYPRFFGLHVDIGAVESTNPPVAPVVVTLPASGLSSNTATLNASVAPNGAVTVGYIEYGLTTNYGSTSASNLLTAGTANISAPLIGLSPATFYHYRAVATNSWGTTYGSDVVFHTDGLVATNMVLNTNDSGPGSLRQVLLYAQTGDFVTFTNTLSGQTILLTSGQIILSNDVTIDGSALASPVQLNGNHNSRIFFITNATVTLHSLVITNGYVTADYGGGMENYGTLTMNDSSVVNNSAASGIGGGIVNWSTLTLNNSIVANNSAANGVGGGIVNWSALTLSNSIVASNSAPNGNGGGVYNIGTMTVDDSAVLNNSASNGMGGGIANVSYSPDTPTKLTMNNCTVAGNSADLGIGGIGNGATNILNHCTVTGNAAPNGQGGGLYNDTGGDSALTNTIIAGNTASNAPDLFNNTGSLFHSANSLTNGNPLLAPLGDYGGLTPTMPPLYGSPAIDAGLDSVTNMFATDQRGYSRKSGAHVDIGAVEAQVAPANDPPLLMNPIWSAGGSNSFQFTFINVQDADFTVLAATNVALPLTDWIPIGNAAQSPPGQYQFTDSAATNYSKRFYQVISP